MIPILFEEGTTDFSNNGIGRLSDIISCIVEEKQSGVYECTFKYPVTGAHYNDIKENRIIYCAHDDTKTEQPFDIYGRSAPINGIVVFYAHHVSYRLGSVVLDPFTATSCADAFTKLKDYEINTSPFIFWTDKATGGSFKIEVPTVTRSILGGVEGSILDAFDGGDYEWDGFTVKLWHDRGQDNNVNIRYGVNLADIKQDVDYSSTYNAVVPFWFSDLEDESAPVLVTLPEKILRASGTEQQTLKPVTLDLSAEFETQPTQAQLRDRANQFMTNNQPWKVDENVVVNFVALWQTEDYKNVAPLQRVRIYDYVHVIYDELGINKKMQVIETTYNVLTEKYDRMELGSAKQSFAEIISNSADEMISATIRKNTVSKSYLQESLQKTAEIIRGNRGGYKYEVVDADGHTVETLYMDTPDINTAVNILRIGMSGIAFSNHGYDPQYFVSAWTIDGQFNANFITAGTMSANRIQGGTLKLGGSNNGNGLAEIYSQTGTKVSDIDRQGFRIYSKRNNQDYTTILSKDGFAIYNSLTSYYTANRIFELYYDTYAVYLNTNSTTPLYIGAYNSIIWLDANGISINSNTDLKLSAGRLSTSPAIEINNSDKKVYAKNASFSVSTLYATNVYSANGNVTEFKQNVWVDGNLTVKGTKPRLVTTKDYGERYLYCYETPSPTFGDIGEGVIAEDGKCYIWIDSIFAETVSLNQYQVFLQKYGNGDCWVSARTPMYFVVEGTPNIEFGWEIKAKQSDFNQYRLEKEVGDFSTTNKTDYAAELAKHISKIQTEREVA